MNIADRATPTRQPACWGKPQQALFAAPSLDYDPEHEEFHHLSADEHQKLAADKKAAEDAAVDVCFGCPLMLACEEIDIANSTNPTIPFISGVIGGRTESERRERLAPRLGSRRSTTKNLAVPNPRIAPGDRGPRNQVDDELIKRLTIAGQTGAQIAHELGCSPRTVSRSRRRMGLSNDTPATDPISDTPDTSDTSDVSGSSMAGNDTETMFSTLAAAGAGETITRTENTVRSRRGNNRQPKTLAGSKTTHTAGQASGQARRQASGQSSRQSAGRHPFLGGRPVSPAMEAVYNHLAAVGGSDTLDNLIDVAVAHVDADEAMNWWLKHNSETTNGKKVLRPSKAGTPTATRIAEGARAKVFNSISATERKGRYLTRNGDVFTFKPAALAAWKQRIQERKNQAALSNTAS